MGVLESLKEDSVKGCPEIKVREGAGGHRKLVKRKLGNRQRPIANSSNSVDTITYETYIVKD